MTVVDLNRKRHLPRPALTEQVYFVEMKVNEHHVYGLEVSKSSS